MAMWRTGIALFVFANIFGSTVQLAVLPLALVCTLQAIGLVTNSVLANLILKEPLTGLAMLGTVLVIGGTVIVAGLGGARSDPDISLKQLFALLQRPQFLLWMCATLASAVTLGTYARRLRLRKDGLSDTSSDGRCGWMWGIIAGVVSAHSLLSAKLLIGLLMRDYHDIFANVMQLRFWLIALSFLTFALSQMWCVNNGLQCISTSVLYPLVFCIYNVTTLTNSVLLYGKNKVFKQGHAIWVIVGTAVLITGVLMLSTRFLNPASDPLAGANSLPQWQPRHSVSRVTMGTLAPPLPLHASSEPVSPSMGEHSPLNKPTYTSFDSISPNITNPDKARGRRGRRTLSKEQHKILSELGI